MHRSVVLEQHDMLDPLNELHLFALHYVFIPRINRALSEFLEGWNHHPIRTAHNKLPHQLFTTGALHSGLAALDFFEAVEETYGIDVDGQTPLPNGGSVVVPEINFQIRPDDLSQLQQTIDPLTVSDEYGMDLYEQVIQCISSLPN